MFKKIFPVFNIMAFRHQSTIVCGYTYTLSISNEGTVYSFGMDSNGGHGHKESFVFPPREVSNLNNIQSIDCSDTHTVCLDFEGNVFTFGDNSLGELGIDEEDGRFSFARKLFNYAKSFAGTYEYIPQKVFLPTINQVSCGIGFTMCLSTDGFVYSFGANKHGHLGHGNTTNYSYPKRIESLSNIEFISCGGFHTICKSFENDIYSWGENNYGQLGIGEINSQHSPFKCVNWPKDIIDIKCGESHSLVLTLKEEVFSCGYNYTGQLGRDSIDEVYSPDMNTISTISQIIRIECGSEHSMCISRNSDLYVFGTNESLQLGIEDNGFIPYPVKYPVNDIIDISSRGFHTFIKTSLNEIFASGDNICSQLGVETNDDNIIGRIIQVFQDNKDIWWSNIIKPSRAKSARN